MSENSGRVAADQIRQPFTSSLVLREQTFVSGHGCPPLVNRAFLTLFWAVVGILTRGMDTSSVPDVALVWDNGCRQAGGR